MRRESKLCINNKVLLCWQVASTFTLRGSKENNCLPVMGNIRTFEYCGVSKPFISTRMECRFQEEICGLN